jgi:hypothetical protein
MEEEVKWLKNEYIVSWKTILLACRLKAKLTINNKINLLVYDAFPFPFPPLEKVKHKK